MEPTSSPDNRQSRGLARFWPVHGMPAPAQRHSDEDAAEAGAAEGESPAGAAAPMATSHSGSPQAAAAAQLARAENESTGEAQMVALGSRRGFDTGPNGSARWGVDQGGFPPVDTDTHLRHGGGPVPNGLPAAAGRPPAARPPFGPPAPSAQAQDPAPADQAARPPFPTATPPETPAPRPQAPASQPQTPAQHPQTPAQHPQTPGQQPQTPAQQPQMPAHRPPAPRTEAGPVLSGPGTPDADIPSPFEPASPFAPQETPDREISAIPLGAVAEQDGETSRGAAAVPGGRRRSPDDDAAAARDPRDARDAPETPGRPTGWASVPTSGVPQIAGPNGAAPGSAGTAPAIGRPSGSAAVNGTARVSFGIAAPVPEAAGANGSDPLRADPWGDGPGGDVEAATRDDGTTGQRAAEPQMRPGDVDLNRITFWDDEAIAHFRSKWHEVKGDFVDDPVVALTHAHDLLTDAVNELTESMLAERDELDPLRSGSAPDTESMRMAMRGYREFLERILAL